MALDVTEEATRLAARRAALKQEHPAGQNNWWGLALSGGGIRSATFALGALQAMARAPIHDAQGRPTDKKLLPHFDYLSTVSGGGYIGSYFCSLFIPGRLRGDGVRQTSEDAAAEAYRALAHEPPGRFRSHDQFEPEHPGRLATSWLRENGRYLTPTGNGDLFYAAALAVRNWFSLHYVIGTALLAMFTFLFFTRAALSAGCWEYYEFEHDLFRGALLDLERGAVPIWWSPVFGLAALGLAFVVVFGTAFWLAHPGSRRDMQSALPPVTAAALVAALIAATLGFLANALDAYADSEAVQATLRVIAAVALLAIVAHVGVAAAHWLHRRQRITVAMQRTRMTRLLSQAAAATLVLALVAALDTAGQTLYLFLSEPGAWNLATPAVLVPFLAWALHKAPKWLQSSSGVLSKLPVSWLAAAAGVVLLVLVMLAWHQLAQFFLWLGELPPDDLWQDRLALASAIAAVALLLGFGTGQFANFINLSSLQSFYGARLSRAYLGASNGARFRPAPGEKKPMPPSVAEPHANDDITYAAYYAPDVLAPLHVINLTVNQTIDPGEQLVQRDRKGRPLAVLPHGFTIDGDFAKMPNRGRFELQQPMTIGRWVGLSGAAFSTGLGRQTTLGTSLALGLANVRLGAWWESGMGENKRLGLERPMAFLFKSQSYLYQELTAKFHGTRREWQYLSDGGHFENTALYELLRPERKVRLAVVCDDGCDVSYDFADLANLVRLARIDFQAEVQVDARIARTPGLEKVFGTPDEFARSAPSGKCAMLLTVSYVDPGHPAEGVERVIVLLKPRVVSDVGADIREYGKTHPDFPQETTADQFFDEAQWESYRKLGLTIAERVFADARANPDSVAPALWQYLAKYYGI